MPTTPKIAYVYRKIWTAEVKDKFHTQQSGKSQGNEAVSAEIKVNFKPEQEGGKKNRPCRSHSITVDEGGKIISKANFIKKTESNPRGCPINIFTLPYELKALHLRHEFVFSLDRTRYYLWKKAGEVQEIQNFRTILLDA